MENGGGRAVLTRGVHALQNNQKLALRFAVKTVGEAAYGFRILFNRVLRVLFIFINFNAGWALGKIKFSAGRGKIW